MIDPENKTLKLIVFFNETKVYSEQPTGQRFTSRGIIVTDRTFGTSDAADEHFDQFKKGELPSYDPSRSELPSYDPIFDPKKITSIRDDPIDVAIDI